VAGGLEVADLFASLGLRAKDEEWEKGSKLIEGVKRGLEFFAGFEVVKKLAELVKSTAETAIGAERAAQKIGVTTEAVQELGYAAEVSGVSSETLQTGIKHLALGMQELRTKGTGPAAEAFGQLGISFAQLKNESPDQNLERIAQKFQSMPDGARKTALAMQLFGRAGADLIPLLNRGQEGIVDLRNEAERLGIVMSKDDAESFEKLEESTLRIKGSLEGLKNTAIKALLPIIQQMADDLFEWVKANREIIASSIKGVVQGLIFVIKGLAVAFGVVVDVFQFFVEHAELGKAALLALGLVAVAVGAEAAAAWLIGFAPVVLVVAAITAVILIVHELLKAIIDGKGIFASAWNWMAEHAKRGLGIIKSAFEAVGHFFSSIADAIKDAWHAVIDWITDKLDWLWNKAKKIGRFVKTAGGLLEDDDDSAGGGSAGPAAVFAPTSANAVRYVPPGGTGAVQNNVDARSTVNITANGTDPQGVADIAKKEIAKHHERVWSDADADTGGQDEP
jgi:hypothetical protein